MTVHINSDERTRQQHKEQNQHPSVVITSEIILDTGCVTQDLTSRDKKWLVLSEVSQTETDKYYMISYMRNLGFPGVWASQ